MSLASRVRGWVRAALAPHVDLGSLRRRKPISRSFGFDRGLPIDRHYIEDFLARHAGEIRGDVLEAGDDAYTRRFGGDRVRHREILHAAPGNPKATLVADLARGEGIPSTAYDCIVLTQTLPYIYDVRAAVRTLHRILRPGGVLLLTVPGISQISRPDMDRWGDCWRFTSHSVRRLLEETFPPGDIAVEAHGNVLAAASFLYGLAASELGEAELAFRDPDYELLIAAAARKPGEGPG